MLGYLRLSRNSVGPGWRCERVVNVPARGIGEKTMEELRAWARFPRWHALDRH